MVIKLLALVMVSGTLHANTKIKDLVTINGVRENPLIGYGLVIGLNGTGDGGGEITSKSMKKMFQTLGLNPEREIASKNVAAVIVTAKLSSFARVGHKLDVTVSSIGDASSLAGGTLLITPLKGGDGRVYAIANGGVSIGGLNQGQAFATTGKIPNGAIVEAEVEVNFKNKEALRLSLNLADFTTAARLEKVINKELGGMFASARDSGTIDIIIPTNYRRRVVELVAIIENLKVQSSSKAVIIINERTGTISAGGNITLEPSAISHGELVVEVNGPNGPMKKGLHFVKEKTKLSDLVEALNAIGAGPEDLISIFQSLKANGALKAEIKLI